MTAFLVAPLFLATLFLSASLMFASEPLIARMVLPILGGTPMVWNTCVVFFQTLLLCGYTYAHVIPAWLGSRRHTMVHAVLMAVPFAALPFTMPATSSPPVDGNPIVWLLLVLFGLVGLPFLLLSTSASVLQTWFSETDHPSAHDPYFLYASSNLGSLLALVSYPLIVEPTLRLRDQGRIWSIGYGAFVVLMYMCAAIAWHRRHAAIRQEPPARIRTTVADEGDATPTSWPRRIKWASLAFVPSSLMLGVTTYLGADVVSVPLLWVVPLSLYLLTFVLAFGTRARSSSRNADRVLPWLVLPLAWLMLGDDLAVPLWVLTPLHLAAFVAAALLCHTRLASDRPAPSSLTEFYFWIALGGMLGGLFNTLIAPAIFSSVVEYPLVLVLACLARSNSGSDAGVSRRPAAMFAVVAAVVALTAVLVVGVRLLGASPAVRFASLALPVTMIWSQSWHPTRFALGVGALLFAGSMAGNADRHVLYAGRTFYGVYHVSLDASGRYRALTHGTTLHGMQAVDPLRQHEPLAYYYRTGPIGQAIGRLPHLSDTSQVAVVGLGVGSLASYARPGQRWTFYELDPAVERLARRTDYFTYLRDCGNRCRVILGDARVSLARAQPNQYDLIVLDAFSSDAIPVHLLTSEALSLYRSRLAPGGALAFHISNRHLSLGPVLARLASRHGWTALEQNEQVSAQTRLNDGKSASDWVLMAEKPDDLGALVSDARWVAPVWSSSTPLWTDDFSSLFSVLSFR